MAASLSIQGVDETLRKMASDALGSLVNPTSKLRVTLGPLDRQDDGARLNWFLYRVEPNLSYANMEPPATGWRSAMGHPPLALKLHYLLTAHPGHLTDAGDEELFAHRALTSVMQALASHPVIRHGDTSLSPNAEPLVEPLRISMETLDLESVSKIWTAASNSLRLSVGYAVSLVVLDPMPPYVAGPPVQQRRVAVAPTVGPKLLSATPDHISAGMTFTVAVKGIVDGTAFLLRPDPADPTPLPAGATGWPLTVVAALPDAVTLLLSQTDIAPGDRWVQAVATQQGLLVGQDAGAVHVMPIVTGPAAGISKANVIAKGTAVTLATAHATADAEVFVGGARLDPTAVTFTSATQLQVKLPATTQPGPLPVSLRAAKVAGPPFNLTVVA